MITRVDGLEIREVLPGERHAASDAKSMALLGHPMTEETFAKGVASWEDSDGVAAWDGERCVGHVGAFRFDTTVPGGARVPTAGYTRVGVLPTHTRRGLLRAMMERTLVEARERGQVIASLRASETPIYRRYGFGLGGDSASVLVDSRLARPLRATLPGGTTRLLRPEEVFEVVPALYDRCRWRAGTVNRPEWMWKRLLASASEATSDVHGKGNFVAVHRDADGVDDGFVHYELQWKEDFGAMPSGTGTISELWGTSDDVELALWAYLIGIDLVTTWHAEERPVGEAVRRAMADARAYETKQIWDEQWIRLLDVGAALAARTYGPAGAEITIAVDDPMFPDNAGPWAISPKGVRAASGTADIRVDIAAVSSAYLGAIAWRDLVASGEIDAGADPTVLEHLDALFAVRPAPFCGTYF